MVRWVTGLIGMCSVVACTSVPPLETSMGSVTVDQVVMRIKCEIADAFDNKVEDPHFLWLADWTIKVDLSLLGNLQAGITPSGSFTQNYHNVYNVAAGPSSLPGSSIASIPQNLVVGASANLSEQAIRTEAVSFTLSIDELRRWRRNIRSRLLRANYDGSPAADPCYPNGQMDLAGDLGLREWIDTVLDPVARSELQAGDHPAPGANKTATPAAPAKAPLLAPTTLQEARDFAKDAADAAKKAADAAKTAGVAARSSMDSVNKIVRPYSAVLEPKFRRTWLAFAAAVEVSAAAAQRDAAKASTAASTAAQQQQIADKAGDFEPAKQAALEAAKQQTVAEDAQKDAELKANDAKTNAATVAKSIPDPPIDSIAHSVQFIVVFGAGVSPTWALAAWKGPALNGPFATAGGGRTHTLNLALGPRGKDGVKFSDEQLRQLQLLTIQQSQRQ
jgi:hypothetical protein